MFRSWSFALWFALSLALMPPASQAQPQSAVALPAGVALVTSVEGITEYRLANGLQVLLVPDDSKPTTTVNVTYHVGDLIDGLHDTLTTQIARALQHEARVERGIDPLTDKADYAAAGQRVAIAFLKRIPELRRQLALDVQAAYDGDPACKNLDEVILCYPGLEAVTVYRLAHELHVLGVPFIPRMMTEWAHNVTGIDIHPGAKIGHHFFIDHGTGVVVGETCEIGNHVKLYQGVTLGALSFPTDANGKLIRNMKRHPTLEDRVVIYASATILGGQTVIGHDSVIGSSVWLTESVDPFTIVTIEKPSLRRRTLSSEATTGAGMEK